MELKLNKAKVKHLLGLIEINERKRWYYGNKEHYLKRHNELKTEHKLLIANVRNCTTCNTEINYKGVCEMCYTEIKLNDLDSYCC